MTDTHFFAVPSHDKVLEELGAASPANPFVTAAFFEACRRIGNVAWILGLRDEAGTLTCGCGAFLSTGRLNRTLEIRSLPAVAADSSFWDGLRQFCRAQRVTELALGTFASPSGIGIPEFGAHCARRGRLEFVLELRRDAAQMLGTNHKRNLKKANKAGLRLSRTRSLEAARAHQALMSQSIDRRRSRGEDLRPTGAALEEAALLQSGAADLFQAMSGTTAMSSVLVLRAPMGAYYRSAGTSPDGMATGASHFLIHSIANELRAEGVQLFNLGGADAESSLARFKEGFGASQVVLSAAACYVGPAWRLAVSRIFAQIGSAKQTLLRSLSDRVSRMVVYAIDTDRAIPPVHKTGMRFRALSSEQLLSLPDGDASFRARQLERLHRFGASYAYAVLADNRIAHVSWLLPPAAMKLDPPRVLKARAAEAEITCCETLPEFRGHGLYGLAIRSLLEVARGQGVRRVLMKTATDNVASQAGIEKAGLERVGSAVMVAVPIIDRLVIWRRFR